jgi:hypothetical protein
VDEDVDEDVVFDDDEFDAVDEPPLHVLHAF